MGSKKLGLAAAVGGVLLFAAAGTPAQAFGWCKGGTHGWGRTAAATVVAPAAKKHAWIGSKRHAWRSGHAYRYAAAPVRGYRSAGFGARYGYSPYYGTRYGYRYGYAPYYGYRSGVGVGVAITGRDRYRDRDRRYGFRDRDERRISVRDRDERRMSDRGREGSNRDRGDDRVRVRAQAGGDRGQMGRAELRAEAGTRGGRRGERD